MLITTLGTSHGDATYCRFNSSTLYECGGNLYLIDCGEPVDALLIRAGIPTWQLKAVFITHMHLDHMGGLDTLIKTLLKYPHEGQHTDIFLPEDVADTVCSWMKMTHIAMNEDHMKLITFHTTQPGEIYDDGVLRVEAIRTQHLNWATNGGGFPSFAYKLAGEGKRILHTGDLKGDFSDFPALAQTEDLDLCLCEATHYKPESALPILMTAKIKRLLFIHIHNPWHGPMGEATLLNTCKNLPYPVAIAHDGDRTRL